MLLFSVLADKYNHLRREKNVFRSQHLILKAFATLFIWCFKIQMLFARKNTEVISFNNNCLKYSFCHLRMFAAAAVLRFVRFYLSGINSYICYYAKKNIKKPFSYAFANVLNEAWSEYDKF